MLKTRVLTVALLLPLFVAALFYFPVMVWALFVALLALIAAWEWGGLAGWDTMARMAYVGLIAGGGALLWQFGYVDTRSGPVVYPVVLGVSLIFWMVFAPLWLARNWRIQSSVVLAVTGAILLLPLWLALVWWQQKPMLLLMLMAIAWVSDTAAYVCGRRWGRRKLAVTISPGKTWEGVFGAVVAVSAYYFILQAAAPGLPVLLQGIAGFGLFLFSMVLGIEGDLFESWIKRTAGVKDSGTIFPGHGGALDRIDALTASMPPVTLLLLML